MSILFVSAFLEYVFPPFPGDTLTLLGAFLITAKHWSFAFVFTSVLAGSGLGAMAAFWVGTWLERKRKSRKAGDSSAVIDRLVERFRRHGEAFLVINRFLPAVRSLFFVAAGMAGMRARWVLAYSLVSAALWTLLLIALGSSVGASFEDLERFFVAYSKLVWGGFALLAVLWLGRAVYRRLRSRIKQA